MIHIRDKRLRRPPIVEWMWAADCSGNKVHDLTMYFENLSVANQATARWHSAPSGQPWWNKSKKRQRTQTARPHDGAMTSTPCTVEEDHIVYTHTSLAGGAWLIGDSSFCAAQYVKLYSESIAQQWTQPKSTSPVSMNVFGHKYAFPFFLDLDFALFGPWQPIMQSQLALLYMAIQRAVQECWGEKLRTVANEKTTEANDEDNSTQLSPLWEEWRRAKAVIGDEYKDVDMVVTQTLARIAHPADLVQVSRYARTADSTPLSSSEDGGISYPPSNASSSNATRDGFAFSGDDHSSPISLLDETSHEAWLLRSSSAVGEDGVLRASSSTITTVMPATLSSPPLIRPSFTNDDKSSSVVPVLSSPNNTTMDGKTQVPRSKALQQLSPELRIAQKLGARCIFPHRIVTASQARDIRRHVVDRLTTWIGMHPTLHDLSCLCLRTLNPYQGATVASQGDAYDVWETWSKIVDGAVYDGSLGPHSKSTYSDKVIPCPTCTAILLHNQQLAKNAMNSTSSTEPIPLPCHHCRSASINAASTAKNSDTLWHDDYLGGSNHANASKRGGGRHTKKSGFTSTSFTKSGALMGKWYEGQASACEPVYVWRVDGSMHPAFADLVMQPNNPPLNEAIFNVLSDDDVRHISGKLPAAFRRVQSRADASSLSLVQSIMRLDFTFLPNPSVLTHPMMRRPAINMPRKNASPDVMVDEEETPLVRFIKTIMLLTQLRLPVQANWVESSQWMSLLYRPERFRVPGTGTVNGSVRDDLTRSIAAKEAKTRGKSIRFTDSRVISELHTLIVNALPQWKDGGLSLSDPIAILSMASGNRGGNKTAASNLNNKEAYILKERFRPVPSISSGTDGDADYDDAMHRKTCLAYDGPYWLIRASGHAARYCSMVSDYHSQNLITYRVYPYGIVQTCYSNSSRRIITYSLGPPVLNMLGQNIPAPQYKTLPCAQCGGIIIPISDALRNRLFIAPSNRGVLRGGRNSGNASSDKWQLRRADHDASSSNASTSDPTLWSNLNVTARRGDEYLTSASSNNISASVRSSSVVRELVQSIHAPIAKRPCLTGVGTLLTSQHTPSM